MPRQDYDEIKNKFELYVKTWKSGDATPIDDLTTDNVSFHCSAAPNSNTGWDSQDGVKTFTQSYPKTDVLQIGVYNYACRIHGNEAQMSAIVCCESLNYVDGQEEMDGFSYSITCAVHWVKTESGWKFDELHMDVYPFYWTTDGLYKSFADTWYFGSPLVIDGTDGRIPAIIGEFDLPWERFPECEDVLTEEEKIVDSSAKMFTSADYSINLNRCTTRSQFLSTNAVRCGKGDGIRATVANKRIKRLKERYWSHPWRFDAIEFNEDKTVARCLTYRPFGWKQRNHEFVWTRSNVGIEHANVGGYDWMEYVKEDGVWKWADDGGLRLGIYGVDPYHSSLYGDRAIN